MMMIDGSYSFTRTGLGTSHEISAGADDWDAVLLHGGWLHVAGLTDGCSQRVAQVGLVKRLKGGRGGVGGEKKERSVMTTPQCPVPFGIFTFGHDNFRRRSSFAFKIVDPYDPSVVRHPSPDPGSTRIPLHHPFAQRLLGIPYHDGLRWVGPADIH